MTNVLIVEDEFLVACDMAEVIRSTGCEVIGPFSRAAPALQAIATEDVACAVLDYRLMGGETSQPVIEALQVRRIPFVIVSASPGVVAAFPDVPAISKPLPEDALIKAIRTMSGGGRP